MIEQQKLHVCAAAEQTTAPGRNDFRQIQCSKIWAARMMRGTLLSCGLVFISFGIESAQSQKTAPPISANAAKTMCLDEGGGFLRAKITGSIKAELNWPNVEMECSGATRPSGGVRIRFSHAFGKPGQKLVFLFGIPGMREGSDARELPVNVTVIREGAGEFYGTRGDDKCTIDKLHQEALAGVPLRNRRYRIIASGFCMQPARAIGGEGSILITRFDFAGRVDYSEEDKAPDQTLAETSK